MSTDRPLHSPSPGARAVTIIGAAGGFGRLFGRRLAGTAILSQVDVAQPAAGSPPLLHPDHHWPAIAAALAQSDIALFCTSEEVLSAILPRYIPALKPGALIVDICSVKRRIVAQVAEHIRATTLTHLSIHPMFGPHVGFKDQNVVCITPSAPSPAHPFKHTPAAAFLLTLLADQGARIHWMTAEHHDRGVIATQVFCHSALMSLGLAVQSTGLTPENLRALQTPNSRVLFALLAHLAANDPDLYFNIQSNSDPDTRRQLSTAAAKLAQSIDTSDRHGFTEMFTSISRWFGEDRAGFEAAAKGILSSLPTPARKQP